MANELRLGFAGRAFSVYHLKQLNDATALKKVGISGGFDVSGDRKILFELHDYRFATDIKRRTRADHGAVTVYLAGKKYGIDKKHGD